MRYDLARMVRGTRRSSITLKPVPRPATLASDLYQSAYAPIVQAWSEALPAIMLEYERSLSAIMQDSPANVSAVVGRAAADADYVISLSIRLRISQWALKLEKRHLERWAANIKAATGLAMDALLTAVGVETTIGAAVEANVNLVKSVSEQVRTRISQAVIAGLAARKPARVVATEIREAVAMSRTRSLRVAADQMVKLSSQLDRDRAIEAGLEYYEWVHSGKLHPRAEHIARNGKRYKYGEPDDQPGMLPFCGCTSRAVLTLDGPF